MTPTEAVAALNSLKLHNKWGRYDQEQIHIDADKILLQAVHADVKAAYDKLDNDVGGFWYS